MRIARSDDGAPAAVTTASAVNKAPRTTFASAPSERSSGENTSTIPAIPSRPPSATRTVIGVPIATRTPSILSSGMAENPTATNPDTTSVSA